MIQLLYASPEELKRSLKDADRRVLFHPELLDVRVGEIADIQVAFSDSNMLFPMKAQVSARRVAQKGSIFPQGLYYEIIQQDAGRFCKMVSFAYGTWRPRIIRRKRVPLEASVSYRFSLHSYRAQTRDISVQGLFVRSDCPLPEKGEQVQLRLKPSWYSWPILLEGRVCWIDPVESRRGMGLKCHNPAGLRKLENLVQRRRAELEIERAA